MREPVTKALEVDEEECRTFFAGLSPSPSVPSGVVRKSVSSGENCVLRDVRRLVGVKLAAWLDRNHVDEAKEELGPRITTDVPSF